MADHKTTRTKQNPLWEYFCIDKEDSSKAICKICKQKISRGSKNPHKMTTSSLNSHLKNKHNSIHSKLKSFTTPETSEEQSKQSKLMKFCLKTNTSETCDNSTLVQPGNSNTVTTPQLSTSGTAAVTAPQPSTSDTATCSSASQSSGIALTKQSQG